MDPNLKLRFRGGDARLLVLAYIFTQACFVVEKSGVVEGLGDTSSMSCFEYIGQISTAIRSHRTVRASMDLDCEDEEGCVCFISSSAGLGVWKASRVARMGGIESRMFEVGVFALHIYSEPEPWLSARVYRIRQPSHRAWHVACSRMSRGRAPPHFEVRRLAPRPAPWTNESRAFILFD